MLDRVPVPRIFVTGSNYKATFKMLCCTWSLALYQCDEATGARLCGYDSKTSPLSLSKRIDAKSNNWCVDRHVVQRGYLERRDFDFLLLPAFLSAMATACF
jgi:hypothetical protein